MQVDSPEKIRNIAVAGHNDTGKTTLVSALLYAGGVTTRMHRVEDGNTLTDFDHEEIERKHLDRPRGLFRPLAAAQDQPPRLPRLRHLLHRDPGRACAPPTPPCSASTASPASRSTPSGCGSSPPSIELPVLVNLTKMDRERADFDRALDGAAEALRPRRAAGPDPHRPGGGLHRRRRPGDARRPTRFTRDGNGKADAGRDPGRPRRRGRDPPRAPRRGGRRDRRQADGGLLRERHPVAGGPGDRACAAPSRSRQIFPLTLTAGGHGIGPSALLDALLALAPLARRPRALPGEERRRRGRSTLAADPPAPPAALVFKTLSDPFTGKISHPARRLRHARRRHHASGTRAPRRPSASATSWRSRASRGPTCRSSIAGDIGGVAKLKITVTGDTLCAKERRSSSAGSTSPKPAMAFAVEPKSKGDEEKIGDALHRLIDEDPTLHAGRDPETHEHLLSGHRPAPHRDRRRQAQAPLPRRRHPASAEGALPRDHPQARRRPRPAQEADRRPRPVRRLQDQGRAAAARRGLRASSTRSSAAPSRTTTGRRSRRGSRRPAAAASSPATRWSTSRCGCSTASTTTSTPRKWRSRSPARWPSRTPWRTPSPTILEPIMKVEITTTEEFIGDIMGDLSHRRGRPQGMDAGNGSQVIKALVPMSEMLDYDRHPARHDPGPVELPHGVLALRGSPQARCRTSSSPRHQKHRQEEHE